MENKKPLKVLGYARVSTENQLENYSIAQQKQRLTAYCQAKGWELAATYVDGGYSGGNMERPALKGLLAAVESGGVDAVLVYKLDRLSRSQKDTLLLIEDGFLAHGTDFISINENFDTSTPFGRAMIGMLSVFAQLERDQITERFTMGRIGRSKAGYFHGGGSSPTGYDYRDGLLVVNEFEALQVREAFSLFLSGHSINAVSRTLCQRYSPTWSAAKVRNVLKNSLYTGQVHFKGQAYPGRHQPLVREEDFRQVQRLLEGMAAERPEERNPFRAQYLLSGLVSCGQCGARYAAGHGRYRCYSRSKCSKKYVRDPACRNRDWKISLLDERVFGQIRALLEQPGTVDALWSDPTPPPKSDGIRRRLRELDVQLDRLAELYQLGSLPADTVEKRAQGLTAEREALLAQVNRPIPEAPHAANQLLPCFYRGFQAAPMDQRRAFVASLIREIQVDGDRITIFWRI